MGVVPPAVEPLICRAGVGNLTASADEQMGGAVQLTWSEAENAQVHFVVYVKTAELSAGSYGSARMVTFAGSQGVVRRLEDGTSYSFHCHRDALELGGVRDGGGKLVRIGVRHARCLSHRRKHVPSRAGRPLQRHRRAELGPTIPAGSAMLRLTSGTV